MEKTKTIMTTRRLVITGLCLALGVLLPQLVHFVPLPAGMTAGEHGALSVPTRTGMDGFFLCAMQKNGEKLQ